MASIVNLFSVVLIHFGLVLSGLYVVVCDKILSLGHVGEFCACFQNDVFLRGICLRGIVFVMSSRYLSSRNEFLC